MRPTLLFLLALIGAFSTSPRASASPAYEATVCTPRLANLSTRGWVDAGDRAMIGGFIVADAEVAVVVRALGPSLISRGIDSALEDPSLEIFQGAARLAGLDDGTQGEADWASGLAPTDPREPAIALRLPPGEYTAIVRGRSPGVGLVELFQVAGEGRLSNLSTRAWVGAGEAVPIGGLIVKGAPQLVALRALGPSLARRGITTPLEDPRIDLYRGGLRVGGNDSWNSFGSVDFASTQLWETGLGPKDPREAALLLRLDPGAYTLVLRGAEGGNGIALFEAFTLPDPGQPGSPSGHALKPVSVLATDSIPLEPSLNLGMEDEDALESNHGLLALPSGRALVYRSACDPGMAPYPGRPVDCRTRTSIVEAAADKPLRPLLTRTDDSRALVDAVLDDSGRRAYLLYKRVIEDTGIAGGYRKDYQLAVWDLDLLGPAIAGGRPSEAEIATHALAWTEPTGSFRRPRLVLAAGHLAVLQEGGVHIYAMNGARAPSLQTTIDPEARDLAFRDGTLVVLGQGAVRVYALGSDGLPELRGGRGVSTWATAVALHQDTLVVASSDGLDCPGGAFGGDICFPVVALASAYALPLTSQSEHLWQLSGYGLAGEVRLLLPIGELLLWGDRLIDTMASMDEKPAAVVSRLRAFDPYGLTQAEGLALLSSFTVAPLGDRLLALGSSEAGFSLHRFRIGRCGAP